MSASLLERGDKSATIHLGTCGWQFEDWKNVFYPEGLAANQHLPYYATYLPAVEIDSTFFGPPRPETAAAWAARTPDAFRFAAKAPSHITHDRRLQNASADMGAFLESLKPLGPKTGAVLIQLPPSFRPEADEDALREFLPQLPTGGPRIAIEFRNAEWRRRRFIRLLEEHQVAWVWNDVSAPAESAAAPYEVLPCTTDFLYLRLIGELKTRFRPDGKPPFVYGSLLWARDQALDGWARRIEQHLESCRQIFVLADNHYEGFSPLTCQRLGQRLGITIDLPSLATHGSEATGPPVERDEQMPLPLN